MASTLALVLKCTLFLIWKICVPSCLRSRIITLPSHPCHPSHQARCPQIGRKAVCSSVGWVTARCERPQVSICILKKVVNQMILFDGWTQSGSQGRAFAPPSLAPSSPVPPLPISTQPFLSPRHHPFTFPPPPGAVEGCQQTGVDDISYLPHFQNGTGFFRRPNITRRV